MTIISLILGVVILLFIITYPYKYKVVRKLKRVMTYPEVEEILLPEFKYEICEEDELNKNIKVKEILLESEFTEEKIPITILEPEELKKGTKCLILLHGIRDTSRDWLERGKLRENYYSLLKKGEIEEMIFVIPNSGFKGESWYSNFYEDEKNQYENFFARDLTKYINENYQNPPLGIAGFSMGGYGALKIGLKNPDKFKVIGSFSGAINLVRMIINRRVMRIFKYLYVPRFLFNDGDKNHFVRVFSPWGYKILKNDPYTIIKKSDQSRYKKNKFYLSVGSDDIKPYLMLQQWLDVVGRAKRYGLNFCGKLYNRELHTWEYISKDLHNFLKYFNNSTKGDDEV